MADIASVLRKTIDGLPANTPAIRQKVYEKARATVLAKLEARDPRPAQDAIDRQLAAVDKIIGAVEDDYSFREQVADVFADAGTKAAEASAPAVPPAPAVTPVAPAVPPVASAPATAPAATEAATPLDDVFRETAADRAPEPVVEPVVAAKAPEPPAPVAAPASTPPAIDPASDAFDEPIAVPAADAVTQEAGDASADAPRANAPVLPRKIQPKQAKSRAGLVWGLGLLIVAAGGAYAAWLNKDAISEQITALTAPETPAETPATEATPASTPGDTPAAKPTAPEPTTKFTQRLNQDGTETATSAPTQVATDLTEGKSVSPATQAPAPVPAPATPAETPAAPATPAEATPETPAPAAEQPQQQAIAVGQRAIFYEERTAAEQGTADQGNVVWSQVQESPGGDKPAEPAIRAEISYPGRDFSLRMTIRRNGDETLPASHIIEMVFVTPDNFASGGIDDVLRITFKGSEQAPGTPLLGIPAKIADNFFLIALTDGKAEIEKNEQLLASEQWIDIPVIYKTGRRALLTMEKGIPGEKVFKDVVAAWQANPLKQ